MSTSKNVQTGGSNNSKSQQKTTIKVGHPWVEKECLKNPPNRVITWSKVWPILEKWLDTQGIEFTCLTREQFVQFHNSNLKELTQGFTGDFKTFKRLARQYGVDKEDEEITLIWANVKYWLDFSIDEAKTNGARWFAKAQATVLAREQEYFANNEHHDNFRQWWQREQGSKLESALRSGTIALLDSLWLMEFASSAGDETTPVTIRRRQELPSEAFLTLDQIVSCAQQLCPIHIVMVSHMWLHPNHPDPKGTTLQKVVQYCKTKALEGDSPGNKTLSESPRWGIFWDYASLHQDPRAELENELFYQGLDSLAAFFAHQATHCLQVKEFPLNYPKGYDLPEGANCSAYDKRGWCMLETGLIRLKDGTQNDDKSTAPVVADVFANRLRQASFTNAKNDKPLVQRLYTDYFEQHFSELTFMSYAWCGWGNQQISDLANIVKRGYCPNVTHLNLTGNNFDHIGFVALVDAIAEQDTLPSLVELNLDRTPIGDAGVECLCRSSSSKSNIVGRLTHLYLRKTSIGDRACQALSEALVASSDIPSMIIELQMDWNSEVTSKGAEYLCNLVSGCPHLKRLWVPGQLGRTNGGMSFTRRARGKRTVTVKYGT